MKNLKSLIKTVILTTLMVAKAATAQTHPHNHAKHGMVLFGDQYEIFASHIIAKAPHNYQVILKVNLDRITQNIYDDSRINHRDERIVLVLNTMDLSTIKSQPTLVGTLIRENLTTNARTTLATEVILLAHHYELVFFQELPLSLEPTPHQH